MEELLFFNAHNSQISSDLIIFKSSGKRFTVQLRANQSYFKTQRKGINLQELCVVIDGKFYATLMLIEEAKY